MLYWPHLLKGLRPIEKQKSLMNASKSITPVMISIKLISKLFCLSLIVLILTSCGKKEETAPVTKPDVAIGQIVAIGRVEPETRLTTLASEFSGLITEINVKAGDQVKAGDPILRLSHEVEQAELAFSESKINTTRQDINTQLIQVEAARIKLANMQQKLPRIKALVEKGAEIQQKVDDLEADIEQQQKEIQRIQSLSNATMAKLKELTADANVDRQTLKRRTIVAPKDGQVLNMDLTVGSMLNAGIAICDFAPKSPLTVLVEVDELFTDKVYLGQKALVRTQGETDTLALGEVIYAAPALKKKSIFSDESSNLEDRRVREVRIKLISGKPLLFNSRVEVILFATTK